MESTPCVVLAGGLGSRIKSVLGEVPKCLAPVGDEAFLALLVKNLRKQGFERIVLSLGSGASQVEDYVEAHPELAISAMVREATPLGTGGAILFAMDRLGVDEVVVVNGDTLFEGDASAMIAPLSVPQPEHVRMLGVAVPDVGRFGALQIASDRLVGFSEKGQHGPGWINAGYYRIARPAFVSKVDGEAFSFETDVLTEAVQRHTVSVCQVSGYFTDIGVPQDYFAFCKRMGVDG
ncbi:sugar phosphate nucleotidyltransferase [Massilia sp. UBA6681]|uniref:sugar phosphate nucleotidyltransferase n=1 Tax=Massilia sp. UBA6681 TaxID=1946839 RepID=UPI0025C30DE5|nr:sugar phosphate nucleotidyltransferase [Massilia sp. UBA6681]